MTDLFPGTIHKEDVSSILRQLIRTYKIPDTSKDVYPLEIWLGVPSGNHNFILPNDKAKLEEHLLSLGDLVCLSFPRLNSKPYLVYRVEIAGEYYSCIDRLEG